MTMQHKEDSFVGYNGSALYCQSWQPDAMPKAILVIVHGFGEHSGRYMNLVNDLVPLGYALYGFDLRGHGRSAGARGHIMSWDEYREDVNAYLKVIRNTSAGAPMFLYGHSLGGLIVLDYALHKPTQLQGVIASAPSLGKVGISPLLMALSRIIAVVYPTFTLHTKLDATTISRDATVVKAYRSDPLVHDQASARLGTELAATQEWVQAHASSLRQPFLMVQGTDDRLTAPADGKRFFGSVPAGDKRYIAYDGSYHEVHNDLDQHTLLADMEVWLGQHL